MKQKKKKACVDACLGVSLAAHVDNTFGSSHGAAFALTDMVVSVGFFVGPLIGGAMAGASEFPLACAVMAGLNLLALPLAYVVRHKCTHRRSTDFQID